MDAGARVFPRLGYHNATVEDIITEAGVARSTFYAYYSNKREIFNNIITNIVDIVLATVEAGIDTIVAKFGVPEDERPPDDDIAEALVDLMAQVFHFIDANKGMTKIFLNDLVVIDDDMTRLFHDFQDRFTGDFERLMRFGLDIGFLSGVDARRAAEFIVGGLVHTARNISAGRADYGLDELSREIVDMQLNGLRRVKARVA
jgi:AcrR family transcriptional regulator